MNDKYLPFSSIEDVTNPSSRSSDYGLFHQINRILRPLLAF